MLAQEAADELEEVAAYAPSEGGYAQTSYYGTLGLYAVSLPGLYSTITRAVKFKPISKVYEAPGPAAGRCAQRACSPRRKRVAGRRRRCGGGDGVQTRGRRRSRAVAAVGR